MSEQILKAGRGIVMNDYGAPIPVDLDNRGVAQGLLLRLSEEIQLIDEMTSALRARREKAAADLAACQSKWGDS
jgi:hypothetical protein